MDHSINSNAALSSFMYSLFAFPHTAMTMVSTLFSPLLFATGTPPPVEPPIKPPARTLMQPLHLPSYLSWATNENSQEPLLPPYGRVVDLATNPDSDTDDPIVFFDNGESCPVSCTSAHRAHSLGIQNPLPPNPYGLNSERLRQRVNHFANPVMEKGNNSSAHFLQTYLVNDRHWQQQDGAPIFLFVGPPSTLHPSLVEPGSLVASLAKAYNGLILALEHRYYGSSMPYNCGCQLTNDQLTFLTDDQVMADLAAFSDVIADKMPIVKNPWIIVGPGPTPALYRFKYPHMSSGAIASAAPIRLSPTVRYNAALAHVPAENPDCSKAIGAIFKKIDNMISNTIFVKLLQDLFAFLPYSKQLCPLNTPILERFVAEVAAFHSNAAIFNYDTPLLFNITNPLGALCHELKGYDDDLDLVQVFAGWMEQQYEYQQTLWPILVQEQAWVWQACTQYGYLAPEDPESGLYTDRVGKSRFLSECKKHFGPALYNPHLMDWVKYGGVNVLNHVTNLALTNGLMDPLHTLGPSPNRDLPESVHVINIPDVGRSAALYPVWLYPGEPEDLHKARMHLYTVVDCFLYCEPPDPPTPERRPLNPPLPVLIPISLPQMLGLMFALGLVSGTAAYLVTVSCASRRRSMSPTLLYNSGDYLSMAPSLGSGGSSATGESGSRGGGSSSYMQALPAYNGGVNVPLLSSEHPSTAGQ